MNIALLLPAGLAALAALLLPLLIHLARRSERQVTVFAALRWLGAQARPQRKRRFEDWPLLVVRLLLLAALALLLARPVLYGRPDRTPWIVAVPGVSAQDARAAAGDNAARLAWLAPGFPALDVPPPLNAKTPVASLLRELDAQLPAGTPLTVLVPAVFDGADAERPRLSRRIDWRIVASAPLTVQALKKQALTKLVVRYAPEREPALRYLRAASVAWNAATRSAEDVSANNGESDVPAATQRTSGNASFAAADTPVDATERNLVWLVPGALPGAIREWIAAGGIALVDAKTQAPELDGTATLWRAEDGTPRVTGTSLGRGRLLQLKQAMVPSAMPELLDANFPQRLRALFAAPLPKPSRAGADAYAPVTGAAPYPETPRPLAPWLVIVIGCLFLVERWLASGRRLGESR